ncbi:30S ribosomal protein S4 [Candidatus Woesearchaeota archaeon]|nr:30S ribosomal protein S4 [Candidatus Woesearchaeota archaeon]HIH38934.1 30S ribosomal protein S4 [Candidatus Woesearchaeota archaeon]HIH49355.1 30S ribosomal protein S4 [Candidatus Woesearchaeota archaeon]HIJ03145.1 30S ribosomal protein S4 [Candidatus Woesearchaeota archaeon]
MGDPKASRKKYSGPRHPWQKQRIQDEKVLMRDYGLKNKKELWKMGSLLSAYRDRAKKLIARPTPQTDKLKTELLSKLAKYGMVDKGAYLDQVLGLELKSILDRRLQSIIVKKGLARTQKQARQFIVHNHILVGERLISSPGYLVALEEEPLVVIVTDSPMASESHPERISAEQPAAKAKPKKKAEPARKPRRKSESKQK